MITGLDLWCSYANASGVEIRPYDFGGVGGIYSIDPDLPTATSTYKVIVDRLTEAGYKERQDLFGAPYDFRLAADGLTQVRLATLVLQTPRSVQYVPFAVCCSVTECVQWQVQGHCGQDDTGRLQGLAGPFRCP